MADGPRERRRVFRWQTAKPETWRTLAPEGTRMRRAPTRAEALLWERLRRRELGVRFRRQHGIDRFIVDFCCLKARLIVEVDGPIHDDQAERDGARDEFLQAAGYRILRFRNDAVLRDIEAVIAAIRTALDMPLPPEPPQR